MKKKNIAFACAAVMSLAGCDSSIDATSAYVTKAKPIIGALVNTLEEANQVQDITENAQIGNVMLTAQFINAICKEDRYFVANTTLTSVSAFNKTVGDLAATDPKTLGSIAVSIHKNLASPKPRKVTGAETAPTCEEKINATMSSPQSLVASVSTGLALLKALTALAAQIEKEVRAEAIEKNVIAFANDSEVKNGLDQLPGQVEQAVIETKRYSLLRAYAFFSEMERLKKLPVKEMPSEETQAEKSKKLVAKSRLTIEDLWESLQNLLTKNISPEEKQVRVLEAATGFNAFAEKYRSLDASQPEANASALVKAINKYVAYVKDGKRTAGEAFDNFMNAIAELDDAYSNFDTARSKYKELTK